MAEPGVTGAGCLGAFWPRLIPGRSGEGHLQGCFPRESPATGGVPMTSQ